MQQYFTQSSQDKYAPPENTKTLTQQQQKILNTMISAFTKPIKLALKRPKPIQKIFIDFHNMFASVHDSKFVSDITSFDKTISYTMTVPTGIITIHVIYGTDKHKVIGVITHALNTFCNFFKNADYNGLTLYVCLDDNRRDIIVPKNLKTFEEKMIYLQKHSLALNVSGMTEKKKKIVYLTRTEEIVKLLFHEMVHYIGLDEKLRFVDFKNSWAISPKELNISETYTEFMAVLLNSAYQAVQIHCLDKSVPIANIYESLLASETTYSLKLTANILKFYGYNATTYKKFFDGTARAVSEPIPLWEYIFLRAICMLNMNFIPEDYVMRNISQFVNIIRKDDALIRGIEKYMSQPLDKNISYNMVDLDWTKI